MSMYKWAEQECRIACKKENPNFNFDSNDFDYGCSCYKSALKAYKSLCEDEHSRTSFNFTRQILERLMRGNPLTPITDEDFFIARPEGPIENSEYLAEQGLKSDIQCPRMTSLFRRETLDGKVSYRDIDRAYCINIENPSDTYYSAETRVVDEFFPITMPYMPENGKYKIYCQTFLTDRKNGDYDTHAILYFITPDGKRVDVNRYQTEKDGKMTNITKEEYEALLEKRIDVNRYQTEKESPMSVEEVLVKAGLKPYKDGNQWCILAGDNIQEGICGFGDTIDEALYQFLIEVLERLQK